MGTLVARILEMVAILSSIVATGFMFFLVIARYLLGLPVVGLHELIMLATIVLYMFGAVIASRNREHLTITFLPDRITDPRHKAVHELIIALLTVIVTIFFIVWSYRMFSWGLQRPQVTPAYRIPLWIPQFAIGFAAVGCTAYAMRDVVQAVRKLGRR